MTQSLNSASILRPSRAVAARRYAVIIPSGCADGLVPGCGIWDSFVRPMRAHADIYGLTMPWGVLPETAFSSWPGFVDYEHDLTERQAARDAADRVRAWMDVKGNYYHDICVLPAGPLMQGRWSPWVNGVRGSPVAGRVRLVRIPKSGGVLHPSVRRSMIEMVAP